MQPLTDKEKFVLDLRYGLTDGQPLKLAEIARLLGVSRQHIWEVQRVAIWKITARPGISQPKNDSKKLWSSTLQKLRAALTYEERQILKQAWTISEPDINCVSPSREQVQELQTKALSMV
ncbi:MAG TPA: sigma factor-like helix-turn-helix DNA-binding protein [Oculatellaceae cyanobacterium]